MHGEGSEEMTPPRGFGKTRSYAPPCNCTKEDAMVSIPKIVSVVSCGVVVCLTLSNAAIAAVRGGSDCAEGKGAPSDLLKCDQEIRQGTKTVRGDVLRIEGDTLLVKRSDGKEVRVHL